jgi:hypothetical protein
VCLSLLAGAVHGKPTMQSLLSVRFVVLALELFKAVQGSTFEASLIAAVRPSGPAEGPLCRWAKRAKAYQRPLLGLLQVAQHAEYHPNNQG